MDLKLILIPVVVIFIGVCYMIIMNNRGKGSVGLAQNIMKDFVLENIPSLLGSNFNVINLLEDAINPQHIWVVAYNQGGMHLIPATSNPINREIEKYEESVIYDAKKQLSGNLFTGNKSEKIDYIPFLAITNTSIDNSKNKIQISVAENTFKFKYQNKDCFGANQESEINSFLNYLNSI